MAMIFIRSINVRACVRAFRSRFDASRALRDVDSRYGKYYADDHEGAGRFRMQNATAARVSTQISKFGYPEGQVAL